MVASLVEARLKDVRLSTVKLRFTPPDSRLTLGSFGGDLATAYVHNWLPNFVAKKFTTGDPICHQIDINL